MPSISSTIKDTGAVDISLDEKDDSNVTEEPNCDEEGNSESKLNKRKTSTSTADPEDGVSVVDVTIHEHPETYETSF